MKIEINIVWALRISAWLIFILSLFSLSLSSLQARSLDEPALDAMGEPEIVRTTNVVTARLSSFNESLQKAVLEQKMKQQAVAPSFWRGLQQKFIDEIKRIAAAGVGYRGLWRPPGLPQNWVMDCSNTTRYLYQKVVSLDLGRTASDQYHFLRLRNRTWAAPRKGGHVDEESLFRYLQVGDLLFWENTYRPERYPPITHVMVYLGRDREGKAIVGGSQSSARGFLTAKRGGPDLYEFDPNQPFGGYGSKWNRVQGRFVAFGRPFRNN
ncbi:MAG: C40 family peptidase [Verrucomicrobiae bacterium]|nr:C40 family peptidase [Verrucomicrobiae bacterium]